MNRAGGRSGIVFLLCGLWLTGSVAIRAESEGDRPPCREEGDARRAFDFELGSWTMDLSRLVSPLSGSDEWVQYQGSSVVRPVWKGEANLGEIDLSGSGGRIEGLSLRLYDPASGLWRIHWASRVDGLLSEPMIGGFECGRGEFFNRETLNGREVLVRFVFSDIAAETFRFEQAFSIDDGRTWEPNWVARFRRAGGDAGRPETP